MQKLKDYLFANTHNFQGEVDPRFTDLAAQFSRLQDARVQQGGAALAVYFQGHKVIDIYTGQQSQGKKWQPDTLAMCYSTGKGVLATLTHILVSHGRLAYDTPVAQYWPEFAQNGKAKMTLRQILSHQSGLFDIRNQIESASEMADWSHMLEVMAKAQPRFEAGRGAAYQPLSFGWLVGGILEKATGQTLANLMQQYLIQPLDLDGAYYGALTSELGRVAQPFKLKLAANQPAVTQAKKKLTSKKANRKTSWFDQMIQMSGQNPQDFQDAMIPKGMKAFSFYSDVGLQAVIPAANGVFTARSLAKIYAMLANNGVWNGQTLIQPQVMQQLSTVQYRHRDQIMPLPMHWRLGYHRVLTLGKRSNGFGHIGFNGSGAWCDPMRGLSFAYTHNFPVASITGDYRLWALTQEALRCADLVLKGRKGWF